MRHRPLISPCSCCLICSVEGIFFSVFIHLFIYLGENQGRVIGRAEVMWPGGCSAIGWWSLSESCLNELEWLSAAVTHGVGRIKRFCGKKVFDETLGGQIVSVCLRVCVSVCASSVLSPGMTEFDHRESHVVDKMPQRQSEDRCCPVNIYTTSLTANNRLNQPKC